MTIAYALPHPGSAGSRALSNEARNGLANSDPKAPQGFEALLGELLLAQSEASNSAGSHETLHTDRLQSFQQARLLEGHASEFRHTAEPSAASGHSPAWFEDGPRSVAADHAVYPIPIAREVARIGSALPDAMTQTVDSGHHSNFEGARPVLPAAIRQIPAPFTRPPGQPVPLPLAERVQAQPKAMQPEASVRTVPDASQGKISNVLVKVLAEEGTPLILLRLPGLTGEERAQLEARMAQLFESFGHRRHRLIIQDTAGR